MAVVERESAWTVVYRLDPPGTKMCPVCGATNTRVILEMNNWNLTRCSDCGYVWKQRLALLHEDLPEDSPTQYDFDRSKEVHEATKIILRHFDSLQGLNVCEIGCGMGTLLNRFKALGTNVCGFEPAQVAVGLARSRFGLDTVANSYFEGDSLTRRQDVFLLWDVVEHVERAESLLKQIARAMDGNSILIIKSGNPDSVNARLYRKKWWYFYVYDHRSFFTKKALAILCERAGLKLASFLPFKHTYGGLEMWQLCKNAVKAVGFIMLPPSFEFNNRHFIDLANDHFISVVKKKSS